LSKAAGFTFRAIKFNIVRWPGMTGRQVGDTGAVGLWTLPDQPVTIGAHTICAVLPPTFAAAAEDRPAKAIWPI
jgi:hypothetical protein